MNTGDSKETGEVDHSYLNQMEWSSGSILGEGYLSALAVVILNPYLDQGFSIFLDSRHTLFGFSLRKC